MQFQELAHAAALGIARLTRRGLCNHRLLQQIATGAIRLFAQPYTCRLPRRLQSAYMLGLKRQLHRLISIAIQHVGYSVDQHGLVPHGSDSI